MTVEASRTIAVSGAGGFVGFHLCERLQGDGTEVRRFVLRGATDWQPWPPDPAARRHAIEELAGCEAVLHLGGRAHVVGEAGMELIGLYRAVNRDTTLAFARAAVEAGVRRFVFVSSMRVNGVRSTRPFRYDDPPAPSEPYAISKHEAELELWAMARQTGLEIVVVRPPLVYGPGVKANFLRLMRLVRSGLPLPLGAVEARRSLVSVWNLADLLVRCAFSDAAPGNTFLVSDDQDIALPQLLELLAIGMRRPLRLFRVSPRLVHAATTLLGQGERFEKLCAPFEADIAHTVSTLDWKPPVPLREGLIRTAEWFSESRAYRHAADEA